jgi:hypothetical protein
VGRDDLVRTSLLTAALAATAIAAPAQAQPKLRPELAAIAFLVGDWSSGTGKVADTGDADRGGSRITIEADGAALLRSDRTETFDARGKRTGGFHQIMLIYPEAGTLHADYSDGEGHVIHYVSAAVTPGRSVVFTGAVQQGAPQFRLAYELKAPGELAVDFGMVAPGGGGVRPIAAGVLRKAR